VACFGLAQGTALIGHLSSRDAAVAVLPASDTEHNGTGFFVTRPMGVLCFDEITELREADIGAVQHSRC